mmetsp:Transcript_68794/g.128362  ORF Transcript_68794/g.128362 Transcript_68794/m.128362 type:complete len:301 (-) Transcript_68794:56-958(-)
MQQSFKWILIASFLLPATASSQYVLNKTDTKCAYQNNDRLFRVEDKDVASCFDECERWPDCNYFSVALEGRYTGVCMGCKQGITDTHEHFTFYTMGGDGNAAPSSGPGLQGYVLDESNYKPNTKCAYNHPDRLFRVEGMSIQDCFLECSNVPDCNFFSVSEEGPYAGVCMGCIDGVTQPHQYFKFYAMPGTVEAPPNPLQICEDMPYEQRVDCGFWGVTEATCLERGCCWATDPDPNPNHIPWCYRLHTAWPGCDMDNGLKTDCGFWGITPTQCEDRGCCFRASPNPNPTHVPWCFPPSE